MDQNNTENIKIDFTYFISSALQNKITWETSSHFLDDLTPTLATAKKVIKVLLKELQKLQAELQEFKNDGKQEEGLILGDDALLSNESDATETQDLASKDVHDQYVQDQNEYVNTKENVDMIDDAEELFSESLEDENFEDDNSKILNLSQFESNNTNPDDDLDLTSIEMKSKRAKLECLICVKTFRYRIEHNKHMKTHEHVNDGVNDSNDMHKIATNENSAKMVKITQGPISKSINNLQADQNIKSRLMNEVKSILLQKSPSGLEVPTKPFFMSTWQFPTKGDSKGKWVTVLINAPYQYHKHGILQSGVVRFICNSCRTKYNKSTYGYGKVTGFGENGMPEYELVNLCNDHACQPDLNCYRGFLNKIFLERYSKTY